MPTKMDSYYLRIGSFVMMGLILVIVGILILGSGRIFQKTLYIETYFNESVQGVTVGSPVKYRGLQVGYVDKITFVNDVYPDHRDQGNDTYSRYIYVLVAITNPILTAAPADGLAKTVENDVKNGLRFKLALQGLTGTAYLELNYLDPKANPPLPIDWKPDHYYIPAAISALSVLSDSIQYILDELRQVDISQLFQSFQTLTDTTIHVMQKTDDLMDKTRMQVKSTVNNLQSISENLRDLVNQAKLSPSSVIWSSPPPKLDPEKL